MASDRAKVVGQGDMLAAPEDDAGIVPGTIRGPKDWREGFGAGLEVYVGEGIWLPFGEVLGAGVATIVMWRGRLSCGLSWDLGEVKYRQGVSSVAGAEAEPEEGDDGG